MVMHPDDLRRIAREVEGCEGEVRLTRERIERRLDRLNREILEAVRYNRQDLPALRLFADALADKLHAMDPGPPVDSLATK